MLQGTLVSRMTGSQSKRDIVVIGGSAGAVDALGRLAGLLPAHLDGAVFVVVHVSALYRSRLPEIVSRRGPLPASHAKDGERYRNGRIYIAPPDAHLLLEDGRIRLSRGPRENAVRPAIDPLFRSAASIYGPRVVGVVLSGTLDDGSLGLLDIKLHGGLTLVQDPDDAAYGDMPRNAIEVAKPHTVASIVELAALIAEALLPDADVGEMEPLSAEDLAGLKGLDFPPGATSLTCPECGGVLYLEGPGSLKMTCQVGHSYAPDSLFDQQRAWVEQTLWAAHRSLREQATLAKHIADRYEGRGSRLTTRIFRRRHSEASEHADALRRLILDRGTSAEPATEEHEDSA